MAASIVAKPVMRTTSPCGQAARSLGIRSTPLASGSFTSTMATSNPRERAIPSPSSPREAVMTSIELDAARPSESSALISTAWSDPTSSTLSSTMRTRARAAAACRRERDAVAILSTDADEPLDDVVHELRVGRALRLLHHLPYEEPEQVRLACGKLGGLLRVSLDDLLAHGLDGARVAHLL